MNRQTAHQQQRRALGLCVSCGAPSEGFSRCQKCRDREAERRRAAGAKPWTRGTRGRPPKAELERILASIDWSKDDAAIVEQTGLTLATVRRHRAAAHAAA